MANQFEDSQHIGLLDRLSRDNPDKDMDFRGQAHRGRQPARLALRVHDGAGEQAGQGKEFERGKCFRASFRIDFGLFETAFKHLGR